MSLLFSLKQGALLPAVELTLSSSGFSYDLSAASAIEFRYRKYGDSVLETIACTITDAPNKKVLLVPTNALVDTVGTFECHVKVTISAKELYFPQTGFDDFRVTETF